MAFVASTDTIIGYATICSKNASVVVAPGEHEVAATTALLQAIRDDTHHEFTWWVRSPHNESSAAIAASLGASTGRTIYRMERQKIISGPADLAIHKAGEKDLEEAVRINNEAFCSHPDRAHMTIHDFSNALKSMGNQGDLLLTEGGFVWLKKVSGQETEMHVLAVDDQHRGQGLGSRLIEAAVSHACIHHHASVISLYVEHTNTHAISLYERHHFIQSPGTLRGYDFPDPN